MKHPESALQQSCIKWFRYQYPQYNKLLFHIPNGGSRNVREAARLKLEGVVSGVADLLFSVAKQGYHGLYIEMKVGKGKCSTEQIAFNSAVSTSGYMYIICYSFDEFKKIIEDYLK